MLNVKPLKGSDAVKVTFTLPLAEVPESVSVAGDFNGWDPLRHPLKKRSNGMRSVSIEVTLPARIEFKYLADGGTWFNEPDASCFVVNEYAETNSVLELSSDPWSSRSRTPG